jgi:hypothetical protein
MQGTYALSIEHLQQLNTIIIGMVKYFNDAKIQLHGCKAIHMIAQKYPNAGDYSGQEGGCEAIIAAILKHSTDMDVVDWGLYAISSLAKCKPIHTHTVGDDNSSRLHYAGVCAAVATVMQKYSNQTEVLIRACEAVSKLAFDNTSNVAKLVGTGVHTSVTSAITQHMGNKDVVKAGSRALVELSYYSTNEITTTMGTDGVFKLLPKVLRAHIYNSDIVRRACKAVHNLAMSHDKRVGLGNRGACKAVVDAAKANINDKAIAAAGCKAINYLAYKNKLNKDKLKAAGVHTVLQSVLEVHSGNQDIMRRAQKALAIIPAL